jgi:ubiquinone/menaquinone biosynthesis C-methylase UbiE
MTALIVGAGNFKETGLDFRQKFISEGGLTKNSRVLEIGAGYGRMAVGLTDYLEPSASYHGIEIIEAAVKWCNAEISSRFSNFHFIHADLKNSYSNQAGEQDSSSYLLPFDDNSFDFVFLTSVFSHLKPDAVSSYLKEIYRVLSPGGRCFITYYLLDDFAKAQVEKKAAGLLFKFSHPGFYTTHRKIHEQTIAYDLDDILQLYQATGLVLSMPVLYGSWSGRNEPYSWQDVIVASKPDATP